jgi:hypothetical protein
LIIVGLATSVAHGEQKDERLAVIYRDPYENWQVSTVQRGTGGAPRICVRIPEREGKSREYEGDTVGEEHGRRLVAR